MSFKPSFRLCAQFALAVTAAVLATQMVLAQSAAPPRYVYEIVEDHILGHVLVRADVSTGRIDYRPSSAVMQEEIARAKQRGDAETVRMLTRDDWIDARQYASIAAASSIPHELLLDLSQIRRDVEAIKRTVDSQ